MSSIATTSLARSGSSSWPVAARSATSRKTQISSSKFAHGAVGTDRNDLLFGVPSMNVPQIVPLQPVPAAIPEIPIAKRRDQRGVAKIAVFAYHRATGTPVWQSGVAQTESSSNDVWILGAGPFQRGTIYNGTEFAGTSLLNSSEVGPSPGKRSQRVALSNEKLFTPPAQLANAEQKSKGDVAQIQQASVELPTTSKATASQASTHAAAQSAPSSPPLPSEQGTLREASHSSTANSNRRAPGGNSALTAQLDHEQTPEHAQSQLTEPMPLSPNHPEQP